MDFNDNKPIYLQITDGIIDGIVGGTFPPGTRLPSVREYATRVEVNANTVMRSYDWLQQKHIIINRRGIGFFIANDARRIITNMRRETFFNKEAFRFFSMLASFGMTPRELQTLYEEFLERNRPQPPSESDA